MNQVKEFFEYIFNAIKIWVIVQPWESGLRIRSGRRTKRLEAGIYFRLPYFDSVYVQENRLRVIQFPVQTITSADGKCITLNASVGYSISDIERLYQTLYHPELTIQNIAMCAIATFGYETDAVDLKPDKFSSHIIEALSKEDYGIKFEYAQITNFAVVRTYRLIQDQSWVNEGIRLNEKK